MLQCAALTGSQDELREAFNETEDSLARLTEGTEGVREVVSDVQCVFVCFGSPCFNRTAACWKTPRVMYADRKIFSTR